MTTPLEDIIHSLDELCLPTEAYNITREVGVGWSIHLKTFHYGKTVAMSSYITDEALARSREKTVDFVGQIVKMFRIGIVQSDIDKRLKGYPPDK